MGPCICKYLISHIVVVCLWKYPVWLWNHTACFGLYNDVCCCESCIRRISPSVLIILYHSSQFWALNLASQCNTVTATHNCLFFQFSILLNANSWPLLNVYSGLSWHNIRLILTEKSFSAAVIEKRIWLHLPRNFGFQSPFLRRMLLFHYDTFVVSWVLFVLAWDDLALLVPSIPSSFGGVPRASLVVLQKEIPINHINP